MNRTVSSGVVAFAAPRVTFRDGDARREAERLLRGLGPETTAWRGRLQLWAVDQPESRRDVAEWIWLGLRAALATHGPAGCVDVTPLPLQNDEMGLFVSRDSDPAWCHVQAGELSFRLRAGVIHAVELEVYVPARGPGGYGLVVWLADDSAESAKQTLPSRSLALPFEPSTAATLDLLRATVILTGAFGARLRFSEAMDV